MFEPIFSQKFSKVCYEIEERQELLNAINNFLDETVVLPPGDWDKKNLLSMSDIMELKRKKRMRLAAMEKLKKEKDKLKEKVAPKRPAVTADASAETTADATADAPEVAADEQPEVDSNEAQPEADAQENEAESQAAVPIPETVPVSELPVAPPPPEMFPMSTQTDEEEPVPPVETECRETQVSPLLVESESS